MVGSRRSGKNGHPMRNRRTSSSFAEIDDACQLVSESEVHRAILSLYQDGLRPYGRILRKRCIELFDATSTSESTPKIRCGPQDLRAVCEQAPDFVVELEDGGEWSVLIRNTEPLFIDIYSEIDYYNDTFWGAATEYFEQFSEANPLPGGRYASARELLVRQPPFLEGFSLGEICHVMQLAIARRSILGYANGLIVPYRLSRSMMKSRCAEEQIPWVQENVDPSSPKPALELADLETARKYIKQIMDESIASGSCHVPLSNIKRLFRSRFKLELSETSFGHEKISKLLQDPNFSDICYVELQERGYTVVPVQSGSKSSAQVTQQENTPMRKKRKPPPLLDCYWNDSTVLPSAVESPSQDSAIMCPSPFAAMRRSSTTPAVISRAVSQEEPIDSPTNLPTPPGLLARRGVCPAPLCDFSEHADFIPTPHGDMPTDERLSSFCAAIGCPLPASPALYSPFRETIPTPKLDFAARTPSPQWSCGKLARGFFFRDATCDVGMGTLVNAPPAEPDEPSRTHV